MHLFPEINLEENKLSSVSVSLARWSFANRPAGRYWLEKKNQQQVLIEFAAGLGVDPFLADSWYSVNPDLFYSSKVGFAPLSHRKLSNFRVLLLFCITMKEVIPRHCCNCFPILAWTKIFLTV
jgi:hypothetical protein